MKRLLIFATFVLLTTGIPMWAQIPVPGQIVYDPSQAAHAISQIAQGENIIQNAVQIAQTTLAYYQLAEVMATSPQALYAPWLSPSTYWAVLEVAANTYGNSQPVMMAANTGVGSDSAYQLASVPRYAMISEYPLLSVQGQQQIAATGASTDISDAIVGSSLTTLGTMRSNEIQREMDIENLEHSSQSLDPAQQTYLATFQRMNQGMLLQLRQAQEANQLQQTIALHQLITQKQTQDAIKSKFQDANDYGTNFQTQIAPAYSGGAGAMTY